MQSLMLENNTTLVHRNKVKRNTCLFRLAQWNHQWGAGNTACERKLHITLRRGWLSAFKKAQLIVCLWESPTDCLWERPTDCLPLRKPSWLSLKKPNWLFGLPMRKPNWLPLRSPADCPWESPTDCYHWESPTDCLWESPTDCCLWESPTDCLWESPTDCCLWESPTECLPLRKSSWLSALRKFSFMTTWLHKACWMS